MAVIGIVAPGAMGSAVAVRLREHGAQILTLLLGRSEASRARAASAGMIGSGLAELAAADIILSIVPPGSAAAIAAELAAALRDASTKPVYVDCNAVDVRTVEQVGNIIAESGARFVDGGIIGAPPRPGTAGPTFYLSGSAAAEVGARLRALGLVATVIDGPVGAASALKMSYAGITKGLSAIASMMILGAERAGAGAALRAELATSQPELHARFASSLPDMIPKAYRWVAEMREIAAFLGEDEAAAATFRAVAEFYERIALDAARQRSEVSVIEKIRRN